MMNNLQHFLNSKNSKKIIRKIYKNRYFTNHGPLAKKFEYTCENLFNFRNVISISNFSLSLLVSITGLSSDKKIFVSANSSKEVLLISKMFRNNFEILNIEKLKNKNFKNCKLLIINFSEITNKNITLFEKLQDKKVNIVVCYSSITNYFSSTKFKNFTSVVSLDFETIFNGGLIITNNNIHAETFRNIRSSYGARKVLKVKATCNGRFSEIQAGIGLVLLNKVKKCI